LDVRRTLLGEVWRVMARLEAGELSRGLGELMPNTADPMDWWNWSIDGRSERVPHLLALVAEWCEEHARPPSPALKAADMLIVSALAESHPVAMDQYALGVACRLSRRTIGPRLKALRELKLVEQPHGERAGHVLTDRGLDLLKNPGAPH
jgi:hypothetical protein